MARNWRPARWRDGLREPIDDITLAHKVESELFRRTGLPKGGISVNAEDGVVFLRGVIDREEDSARMEAATRRIAGVRNVEFVKGTIEAVPLPDASVDTVISNCVINLSTDKPAVLAEAYRLLRPGGQLGVSDIVAEDHLDSAQRADRGSYVGCIAGALSISEFRVGLATAGFTDISITPTHQVADGMHSAIIKARKPSRGLLRSQRLL